MKETPDWVYPPDTLAPPSYFVFLCLLELSLCFSLLVRLNERVHNGNALVNLVQKEALAAVLFCIEQPLVPFGILSLGSGRRGRTSEPGAIWIVRGETTGGEREREE